MPTEASLLAQIAVNLITGLEQLPENSSSLQFLKETAHKLLQDASQALYRIHCPLDCDGVLSPPGESSSPQGTPATPLAAGEDTSVASHSRRDFTRWCKTLSLPPGHQFFTVGGGQGKVCFKLVWGRDGKALLETTCPDGVILRGVSPTGVLKAYLKKTSGKETNVDGCKRLSMRSPDGLTQWQIRDHNWLNYEWVNGKFISDEKGIHA